MGPTTSENPRAYVRARKFQPYFMGCFISTIKYGGNKAQITHRYFCIAKKSEFQLKKIFSIIKDMTTIQEL